MLTQLMAATTLQSRYCHYFQFVDEATERPRVLGEVRGHVVEEVHPPSTAPSTARA